MVGCSGRKAPNTDVVTLRLVPSGSFDVFAFEVVIVRVVRAQYARKENRNSDGRRDNTESSNGLG